MVALFAGSGVLQIISLIPGLAASLALIFVKITFHTVCDFTRATFFGGTGAVDPNISTHHIFQRDPAHGARFLPIKIIIVGLCGDTRIYKPNPWGGVFIRVILQIRFPLFVV